MTDVPTLVPDRFSLHNMSRSSVAFSSTSLIAQDMFKYTSMVGILTTTISVLQIEKKGAHKINSSCQLMEFARTRFGVVWTCSGTRFRGSALLLSMHHTMHDMNKHFAKNCA